MRVIHRVTLAAAASVAASAIVAAGVAIAPVAQAQTQSSNSFVGGFSTHSIVASTVPGNGDINPYGVAVVRHSLGKLHKGDILVSNFNDKNNAQGTGTTIVEISPDHHVSLFAQINAAALQPGACPGGVGLTTALAILHGGWVVVGSLPTTGGNPLSAKAGCLLVLNNQGQVVETFHGHGINGPWDMTAVNFGGVAELFVTNVLNGTVAANSKKLDTQIDEGTVLRLVVTTPNYGRPRLLFTRTVGSRFPEELDAGALVIGPTGVGLGRDGTLYVADTIDNRIAAIRNAEFRFTSAGPGKTVTRNQGLNGPLGLAIAPNGDILTVNSGDGNLVETTPFGMQFKPVNLDSTGSPPPPGGAGALFGLAVAPHGSGIYFVDDDTNTLDLLS